MRKIHGWMDRQMVGGWTQNEYVLQKRRFVEQKKYIKNIVLIYQNEWTNYATIYLFHIRNMCFTYLLRG